MKLNKFKRKTLGCTLLAAPLLLLNAASSNAYFNIMDSEIYAGLGYGQYKLEFDNDDTDFDEDEAALKVFVGGQVTEAIGLEISYIDFDEANDFDNSSEINGWTIAPVFSVPLHEYISLFGKVGLFVYDVDLDTTINTPFDSSTPIGPTDFDGEDIFYGGGVKIGLGEYFDLRLEYEKFELDDDIDPELEMLSANIQYVFDF